MRVDRMELREPTESARAEELARILADFDLDLAQARRQLRDLSGFDPREFARIGLAHLARGDNSAAANHLARLIGSGREYVDILTDPDRMTERDAMVAASAMVRGDPEFHRKLLELRGWKDARRVFRILQLIERDEQAMALVPWLRELVDDGNSRLASKAAMILSRLTKNPMVVQRFLASDDPRVRANAVEGLWGAKIETTRGLLHSASRDSNHRVVANALVELCRCGDSLGRERIEELAGNPDARFRAAIAWAIGEIGSPEFLPILRMLEHDSALAVRLRAGRTAKRLQETAG